MKLNKPNKIRAYPSHGINTPRTGALIVFVTACTKSRKPWLANDTSHRHILDAWDAADTWAVGRYVLMPDHVHFFASPVSPETDLGAWMRFWKSHVSRANQNPANRWQKDYWDTRLRTGQSYDEKWQYIRENPIRHNLVTDADDWPYQGELVELQWP
jgi:putative transposase